MGDEDQIMKETSVSTKPTPQITKKKRRNRKKKGNKEQLPFYAIVPPTSLSNTQKDESVEIEYVFGNDMPELDDKYKEFEKVFEAFSSSTEDSTSTEISEVESEEKEGEEEKEEKQKKLSKKQRKKDKREKIEWLKLLVDRPDIVEVHDVNSSDPLLLVLLKSYRNTVQVPRHWCQRRKYLQGKRGIEKPPFELPDFIRNTGISEIRQAVLEKEESQKLKQKARERVQPKMGKIDIDYQVLYDAFFRFQTKPKLSGHGDLYYEGKEYEVDVKERRPGHLSKELRKALGMPEDGVYPPPWLIQMQRHGPPPSYPHLKIPGLNAPIPPGAKNSYHAVAWGQPPVDENGRPLYGDWDQGNELAPEYASQIERGHWGELEVVLAESEEEEEEEQDDTEMGDDISTDEYDSGTSSVTSVSSGFETPERVDLRKQKVEKPKDTGPKQLYQELKVQETSVGNALFGSQHKYVLPGAEKVDIIRSHKSEKVEVILNPSDLEEVEGGLTDELIQKKYKEQLEAAKGKKEDVSDIIAEESAKRKRKEEQKKKKGKKDKFKF